MILNNKSVSKKSCQYIWGGREIETYKNKENFAVLQDQVKFSWALD